MAPLVARGKYLALASDDAIFIVNTLSGEYEQINIPPIQQEIKPPESKDEKKTEVHQEVRLEDVSHIKTGTCLAFSECGSFLAACTPSKNLTIWRISNHELLKQWITPRKVSSLTFTHKNQLIVADKAGDCYTYSFLTSSEEKGKLILGHLSYILDVVITHEDKFVITSERDEKIRVSRFPNAYNIHNFCLGHTEFVTSLSLLSPNLLLSGSGDATIRLWNFIEGQQLHLERIRTSKDEDMDKAVRSIVTHSTTDGCKFAAVLLNKCQEVLMYRITLDSLKFEPQQLILNCCPLAAAFTEDGILHVMTDDKSCPIQSFQMDHESKFVPFKSPMAQLLDDENHLKFLQDCSHSCDGDLKPLYKRWFDNVQEYQQRKNDRLAKAVESSDVSTTKRIRVE